jgi:hypothetical protein
LFVKGSDLLAATHGRSFWVLDDLSPLYQLDGSTAESDVTLFAPRPAVRYRSYGFPAAGAPVGYADYKGAGSLTVAIKTSPAPDGTKSEQVLDAGKNPPSGVIVHYYLKQAPEKAVKLRIVDASGTVLRTFTSDAKDPPKVPVRAGANRFVWDLRGERPTKLEQPKPPNPYGVDEEAGLAPWALPGEYVVELVVEGTTGTEPAVYRQPFTVSRDPRLSVSDEALREQFEMKAAIRDRLSQVHEALNTLRRVSGQVDSWTLRAKSAQGAPGDGGKGDYSRLTESGEALKGKLSALEGRLINVDQDKPQPGRNRLEEKLVALSGLIDESDDAPTQGAREVLAKLHQQVQEQLDALRQLLDEDVPAFNRLVGELELPPVGA